MGGTDYPLGVWYNDVDAKDYVWNNVTYKFVTISNLGAGTYTIKQSTTGGQEVGLFYVKVETNVTNHSATLNAGDGILGLWKSYSTTGMTLYLGGWKYQSDSKLKDKYTRHSDAYLDQTFDPDYDYEGDPDKNPTTKQDSWEAPETQYKFGTEDPYYFANNCQFIDFSAKTFEYQRKLTSSTPYPNNENYSYNTIDNGRNEYIESGYSGGYLFDEANPDWGKTVKGDPFTVPCFGDFIKLEPTNDGTITLYVMQNGTIDFNTKDYRRNDTDKESFPIGTNSSPTYYGKWHGGLLSKVCWRPVYIVDEAGTRFGEDDVKAETQTWITVGRGDKDAYVYDFGGEQKAVLCVDINDNHTINSANYVEDNNGGYVTDSEGNVVSWSAQSGWFGSTTYSAQKYRRATYKSCVDLLQSGTTADKAHYDFFTSEYDDTADGLKKLSENEKGEHIVKVWPEKITNNSNDGTDAPARVWGPKYTGDGWVIISKGYVKYTFHVKAGKSYYVFANDTKVGFCGYEFSQDAAPTGTLALKDDGTGNQLPTSTTTYKTVTLERKFNKGWNAICLPFSVSESQMRKNFSSNDKETYELVTYNGVGMDEDENEDGTKETHRKAFFFHHVYQDIIAGYPYMLYIADEEAPAIKNGKAEFTNVTVEPDATLWRDFTTSNNYMPKNVSYYNIAPEKCFTFTGFYEPTIIQKADYYVVPDGLQLYTNDTSSTIRGFRAFLCSNERPNGVKEMIRLSGTNFTNILDDMDDAWKDATVINGLAEEMGFFQQEQNVYSVSGQLIRANSASLAGLPKGIYIVNGKKYFVK